MLLIFSCKTTIIGLLQKENIWYFNYLPPLGSGSIIIIIIADQKKIIIKIAVYVNIQSRRLKQCFRYLSPNGAYIFYCLLI